MWEQFEEQLTPLFEFLGIPLIILTPLVFLLIVIFKYVMPKMLDKTTSITGLLVANIVTELFGEGDGSVKGISELDLVKIIKALPDEVQTAVTTIDTKLNQVTELVALITEAMMAERMIKPQSSRLLREVKAKSDAILAEANAFVDALVKDDVDDTEQTEQITESEV